MKELTIASIQTSSLPYDAAKIDYFLTLAKTRQAKVVVLGEYVLNLFFKELENAPYSMIEEQSKHQMSELSRLAKIYNLIIIAPLVVCQKQKYYKSVVVFSSKNKKIFHQQILMGYDHWNEESFFSNEVKPLSTPPIITVDGVKLAILMGYEIHFDPFWLEIMEKKVDCVIVPTVSTFGSDARWRNLLSMRAFVNNLYVLRVNRIGSYQSQEYQWNFYGDTLLVNPYGEIEECLGENEEMMISVISKKEVAEARKGWKFGQILHDRGVKG